MNAKQFRSLRKLWGLSQKDLAKILGVNERTVANYEYECTQISGPATNIMNWLSMGFRPPEWPAENRHYKYGAQAGKVPNKHVARNRLEDLRSREARNHGDGDEGSDVQADRPAEALRVQLRRV